MPKKVILLVFCLALSGAALGETWTHAPLIDAMCSKKAKAEPDAHKRSCALQCQKSGFGILTEKGDYLRFDSAGNTKALQLLKNSKQEEGLRVTVSGEQSGDNIKVQSIQMDSAQ